MTQRAKQLLVEGVDDLLAVVGIMQHHVSWPRDKEKAPVFIHPIGSIDEILDAIFLNTKMKESGLDILGIMIDADDKPNSRWSSLRSLCGHMLPELPPDLPEDGLIMDCPSGLRFGFWLMPDCSSNGMLETFLRHLVPGPLEALWTHAEASFKQAQTFGAGCREAHYAKALVHTWLAWQDPPGERMGIALTRKILDPSAPTAAAFVTWFKNLYRL